MTLVSEPAFRFFLSAVTGVVAGGWAIHDLVCILQSRWAERHDPLVTDKWFGYLMGIVIGTIGVVGTLRFNGVL